MLSMARPCQRLLCVPLHKKRNFQRWWLLNATNTRTGSSVWRREREWEKGNEREREGVRKVLAISLAQLHVSFPPQTLMLTPPHNITQSQRGCLFSLVSLSLVRFPLADRQAKRDGKREGGERESGTGLTALFVALVWAQLKSKLAFSTFSLSLSSFSPLRLFSNFTSCFLFFVPAQLLQATKLISLTLSLMHSLIHTLTWHSLRLNIRNAVHKYFIMLLTYCDLFIVHIGHRSKSEKHMHIIYKHPYIKPMYVCVCVSMRVFGMWLDTLLLHSRLSPRHFDWILRICQANRCGRQYKYI